MANGKIEGVEVLDTGYDRPLGAVVKCVVCGRFCSWDCLKGVFYCVRSSYDSQHEQWEHD